MILNSLYSYVRNNFMLCLAPSIKIIQKNKNKKNKLDIKCSQSSITVGFLKSGILILYFKILY